VVTTLGLWPFDVQTRCTLCPNGAGIVRDLPGFAFPREGMVLDPEAGPALARALAGADGLTLAVLARPDRLFQEGPARIVSVSEGPASRNLTLGQERARLELRLRTPATGANGSAPATRSGRVVRPGRAQLYVATYDREAFRLYVDGTPAGERRLAAGGFAGWAPDMPMVFGNETTGNRPWRGHLLDAAIYARALSAEEVAGLGMQWAGSDLLADAGDGPVYHLARRCPAASAREVEQGLAVGSCLIPATYRNDHVLAVLGTGHRQATDYLQGALLWLPLGMLALATAGARRRMAAALLLGLLALAAGIEVAQAWLFSRSSSLQDLLAALAGLAAGAALSVAAARRGR
jgi:hypothetical protein